MSMASFSRGQLPARQTKVVDESQRPLKTGSPRCGDLRNDVTSSKLCFNRGQLPARQTKVVDESQRPSKTGSLRCGDLRNDVTSSKLCSKGRDVAEDSQGGACDACCVFFFFV